MNGFICQYANCQQFGFKHGGFFAFCCLDHEAKYEERIVGRQCQVCGQQVDVPYYVKHICCGNASCVSVMTFKMHTLTYPNYHIITILKKDKRMPWIVWNTKRLYIPPPSQLNISCLM